MEHRNLGRSGLKVSTLCLGAMTFGEDLGWGASVGGMAGAAIGAGNRERKFSDLAKDASEHGYFVLVAHTETPQQTELARSIIAESVKDGNNDCGAGTV